MKKYWIYIFVLCLLSGCSINKEVGSLPENNQFYYNNYNETDKRVYDLIYDALVNKQESVDLSGIRMDSEKIFDITSQVSDDHPEFFYFFGDANYSYTDYFVYLKGILHLTYAYDLDTIHNYEAKLGIIKNEYLKEIQGFDQMQVLEYTYDYLVTLLTYDHNTLESMPNVLEKPNPYGLIGALIDHQCVCAGYAKAFQYLVSAAGYECQYVRGYLQNDLHAWDAVKIGDQYYHFDVTSDDIDETGFPPTFYQFFGLNTTQILQSHIIDNFVSEHDDMSYNYHVYHHHFINSIDELDNIMKAQKNESVITIQCDNEILLQEIIDTLITNKKIYDYIPPSTIHYITGSSLYMLCFYK